MKGGVDAVGKRGVEREEKKGWRGEERGDDEKEKKEEKNEEGYNDHFILFIDQKELFFY